MSSQLLWIYKYVLPAVLILCKARPLFAVNIAINMPHKCEEGAVTFHPEDCATYLQCLNGEILFQTCPVESYFDATYDVCVIDEHEVCAAASRKCLEGEIKEIPGNSCGYLKCINGSLVQDKCDIGTYFNATLKICEIDENGICLPAPAKCLNGEIKVDPNDCSGYLKCLNGSFIEGKCANGSFFNSTLQICAIDENGICIPASEKCVEGKLEEDPEDCSGYLKCENGTLIIEKCAIGSFFNSTLEICEIDENEICTPKSEKCLEGEVEKDPKDCSGYLTCLNGSLIEEKCAKGSFFNPSLKICEVDENGICIPAPEKCLEGELEENPSSRCGYLKCINESLKEFKCANGSYYNSTLQSCLIDENGICRARIEKCNEREMKLDPEDCAGYIQCVNGELIKKLCSYGSYFHTILHSCVVDDEGICIPPSEQCVEGERETDPDDCASYLECIDGDFIAQKCASGRYFDKNGNACIVDDNFVCLAQYD